MENAQDTKDALDDLEPGTPASSEPTPAPARKRPTDEQRHNMQVSFNNRISYLCKLAALIIAVVAFATVALGQEMPQFVLMGLCLSVALLAIAMLQDHAQRKH